MDKDKKKKEDNELESEDLIEIDNIFDEDGSLLQEQEGGIEDQESKDEQSEYETVDVEEEEAVFDVSSQPQKEDKIREVTEIEELRTEHLSDNKSKNIDSSTDTPVASDPIKLEEDEIDLLNSEVEKAKNDEKSTSEGKPKQSAKPNKGSKAKKEKAKKPRKKKKSTKGASAHKKARVDYILSAKKIIKDEKASALMAYLDELLSHLPKKQIEAFARSEHFPTYADMMEEIQKSPE